VIDELFYAAAIHPVRLPILLACSTQPQTVEQLGLGAEQARLHLGMLEEAGLLVREGEAYLATSDWRPLVAALEALQDSATF
jgi:predicted ArsR family transcriptional regulator